MNGPFTFAELIALIGGHRGKQEVACPRCGPQCHTAHNRRRRVLCIWHLESAFITYGCPRCGVGGYVIDDGRPPVSSAVVEKARRDVEAFEREYAAKQLAKARWLWQSRHPIVGTVAERYLREARRIPAAFTLPATLGFLPAKGDYPPALIAAFGIPTEPEPGALAIAAADIAGVHITRLKSDGSGKDPHEPSKIMIGKSLGWPIVLAPANDSGGLGIVEGIEDGLSLAATLGLGIWVAGSASRLPALAECVPSYANDIMIFADANNVGMTQAHELKRRLCARGLSAAIVEPPEKSND